MFNRNTWLSCLLRETEMEQCDRSLDATSSTETGNLVSFFLILVSYEH